ncbi:MAG: hypothetical protein K8R36_19165 [Planctomycetales bacterium]|nr:hypothetical protein [Planctomycetales bacterium]
MIKFRIVPVFFVIAITLLFILGCGGAAQIGGDDETLAAVDALYTAVTSRRTELLEKSTARIDALHSEGKLPNDAYDSLQAITTRAKKGEWERSARDLYRFIQAQRRQA